MTDFWTHFWTNALESLGLAWWVEVVTDNPSCTYYFGPFASESEAAAYQPGYVEDLENEGAKGLQVTIKRCKPKELTVYDDKTEKTRMGKISPAFSGQA